MKKTLISGAILALISTGVLAAKGGNKPEPTPDLTPRVEALEQQVSDLTSAVDTQEQINQEQAIEIQDLVEALGYLQPGGGSSGLTQVFVDSTGKVVGVPGESYSEVLVKFAGTNSTARFIMDDHDGFYVGSSYYGDSSCGQDGGKHYVGSINPDGVNGPLLVHQPAYAYGGGYIIPKLNPQPSLVEYHSSFSGTGECRVGTSNRFAVEGIHVDDPNITMPLHIEFR